MSVEFDPGSGRLRLDLESFEALVAVASGHRPSRGAVEALDAAGVVRGDAIHPLVAPAAGAAADPVVRGTISMQEHTGREISGHMWMTSEVTAMLLTSGEGLELLTTATATFPASMARVVGLRPRPRLASEAMGLPSDMFELLLSGDADERARVVEVILTQVEDEATRDFLTSVVEEPWWYWAVELTWPAAQGEEGERGLHVLDTVGGLAIMAGDQGRVLVEPTTPTDVWAYLTMMLPEPDELAFG